MDKDNGGHVSLKVMSRKEAVDSGYRHYYTGKPCSRGHLDRRFTKSGLCCACSAENNLIYRKENPEKFKEYKSKSADKNRIFNREWKENNKNKISAYRKWYKVNKSGAVPSWDREFTRFVSFEAFELICLREKATGIPWNIDHMIPLGSKNACGLHTWSNFQVIPAIMNQRKWNKFELTEPGEWIKKL